MSGRRARLVWLAGLMLAPVGVAAFAQGAFADTASDPGQIRIMPGSEEDLDVSVQNESADPASLRVRAVDVTEDDNGCVRPEQQAGDVTCGADGGELGDQLDLRLVRLGDAGDQQVWAGTLDELTGGTDVIDQVDGRATARLRLVVALPRGTTNETQSDRVGFTLRWTFTGQPSQTTVLGVQQGNGGGAGSFGALAATGTVVSLALVAALVALLAVGGVLVGYGRRGQLPVHR